MHQLISMEWRQLHKWFINEVLACAIETCKHPWCQSWRRTEPDWSRAELPTSVPEFSCFGYPWILDTLIGNLSANSVTWVHPESFCCQANTKVVGAPTEDWRDGVYAGKMELRRIIMECLNKWIKTTGTWSSLKVLSPCIECQSLLSTDSKRTGMTKSVERENFLQIKCLQN